MARNPATIAWTAFAIAIAIAAGLGVLLWNERRANQAERVRLGEARDSLRREATRKETQSRELTDQILALQQQLSALGDRVSGLEQSNRDLETRLASERERRPRTPAHTDVAAIDVLSGPGTPEIEFVDSLPAVELHLVGEPGPPLSSLNLSPTNAWPVAERIQIPRQPPFLTDPKTMKGMYITFGLLQATDLATTLVGLDRGAYEANPVIRPIATNPSAMIAIKVGTTVGTYFLVEKLRKDKPMTAAILLAALNSTLAVVTVNNMHAAAAAKQ